LLKKIKQLKKSTVIGYILIDSFSSPIKVYPKNKKRSQNYDFLYKILIELQIAIRVTPTSAKTPIHIFVRPKSVKIRTPILIIKVRFLLK